MNQPTDTEMSNSTGSGEDAHVGCADMHMNNGSDFPRIYGHALFTAALKGLFLDHASQFPCSYFLSHDVALRM